MDANTISPRGVPNLQFDPDKHPHATLKAFNEFVDQYEFRYNAQYPEPPRHMRDNAILQWKSEHADAEPTALQQIAIRDDLISRDKVRKLLGFFATVRFQQDWKAAEPVEADRDCTWRQFLTKMQAYYKPTENSTLRNYEFRQLAQLPAETFSAFCNRVEKEGKTCTFCACDADAACDAPSLAIRDQIVIGTHHDKIREQALLKSWALDDLRKEGMKMESAARGEDRLSQPGVNKLGKYSYKNMPKNTSKDKEPGGGSNREVKKRKCFRCGSDFHKNHMKKCSAIDAKCSICSKVGHLAKVCQRKDVKAAVAENGSGDDDGSEEDDVHDTFVMNNVWRVKSNSHNPRWRSSKNSSGSSLPPNSHNFKATVMVNNKLTKLLADTGARVSVCGMKQAKDWGILSLLQPSTAKIRPYQSNPIPVRGVCTVGVTFKSRTVPVQFHVLPGSCEPILAGKASEELNILVFHGDEPDSGRTVFSMIKTETESEEGKKFFTDIQNTVSSYPECYKGIGHLKNHSVKFYVNDAVKPVVVPRRPIPYHLRDRVDKVIQEMLDEGIIEPQPMDEPAPWVSAPCLVPKPDGSIRITLDARNINKAIEANNTPIPHMEEIKSKLSGAKYFSKMDLKSAYWQLELHPDARYLTVFECNGKLYRYKRLLMGVKPAQGELTMALQPIFCHIPDVYLIHDDLVIAAETQEEHNIALIAVLEAMSKAGLTLNASKCSYGVSEIKFWGMIFSADGVRPDPEKVDALNGLEPPRNKEELKSFICMMQSNSDFIHQFSKKIEPLRTLLKKDARFVWGPAHQKTFEEVIAAFRKDTLLRYFDLNKQTIIFVDGHKTGLCAILAQGDSIETAKPVDIKSRSTNKPESTGYPQLDLEAMAVDFALRRFRQYLVGSPRPCIIVTDHKPLLSVFNGRRSGSIRSETIKMRHQNIQFIVQYRKGKENNADFLSRHAVPWESLSRDLKAEADEVTNLLYHLRLSPIVDALGIGEIAKETSEDSCLSQIQKLLAEGKTFIPKSNSLLSPFRQIFSEITSLANGTLLMQDRIILPASLHDKAVRLAHMGAHPGQNGLLRRLRSHFFITGLDERVKKFVETCLDCQTFTTKYVREPIQPNKVPQKCWEEVSVDLFGPLPSSNHVVVVQDLASRFPVAKIVRSTSAKSVLPVLAETYNNFGNPTTQKSDNGPPFNSCEMNDFTAKRNIEQVKIAPSHPAANNVETVMKPLGKAMKIGSKNKESEVDTLQAFLQTYRDTPHSATGIEPGNMIFRDGYQSTFPRRSLSDEQVSQARKLDSVSKNIRNAEYNATIHTKPANFKAGDQVLVRNYNKRSKFEPYFLPERFLVADTMAQGKIILIQSTRTGRHLKRHPNDLKLYEGKFGNDADAPSEPSEIELLEAWRQAFESIDDTDECDEAAPPNSVAPAAMAAPENIDAPLRRSERQRTLNPRYYNNDHVNV